MAAAYPDLLPGVPIQALLRDVPRVWSASLRWRLVWQRDFQARQTSLPVPVRSCQGPVDLQEAWSQARQVPTRFAPDSVATSQFRPQLARAGIVFLLRGFAAR